jgi:hypothetical protein
MKNFLFILTIFIFSCNRHERNSLNVIDLFPVPTSEISKLSSISSDIEYIPLQTTDSSMISRINKISITDKSIFIATLDEILWFDQKGNYSGKLNKKGRGPDEYNYLSDFDVSPDDNNIMVLSAKSIIFYKKAGISAAFWKKIILTISPSKINFFGTGNNILLQYSNEDGTKPFSKILINLDGDTLYKKPNYFKYALKDGWINFSIYENISYWSNHTLYLKELQSDTLFKFTNENSMEASLIFNSGDKRLTPEGRSNGKYFSDHMFEYILVNKIFGSERYIYYSYYFSKANVQGIYDKIAHVRYSIPDKQSLKDDLAGGPDFKPQFSINGIFYSWIDAFKLKEHVSSDVFKNLIVKDPIKKNTLKKIAETASENDNPVIIVAKIK